MGTSMEDGWAGVYPNGATRTSAVPRSDTMRSREDLK
jgi:hypothetical protein